MFRVFRAQQLRFDIQTVMSINDVINDLLHEKDELSVGPREKLSTPGITLSKWKNRITPHQRSN